MAQKTKFASATQRAEVMLITPELAKEIYATSLGNRTIRKWYVSLLASAIRRGEWRVTSQGLGFDADGHLIDAHHRILAIIEAGIAVEMLVSFGLRSDAYEVIDTGIIRTYGDRLAVPKKISETLRLAAELIVRSAKPTIDQIRPVADCGLLDALQSLLDYCSTTRKYHSSAPMKLAAAVSIMSGEDSKFVLEQYRALCLLDYDRMSDSAKSIARQAATGKIAAGDTPDAMARGLRVFDRARAGVTRVQVSEADAQAAVVYIRAVISDAMTKRAA